MSNGYGKSSVASSGLSGTAGTAGVARTLGTGTGGRTEGNLRSSGFSYNGGSHGNFVSSGNDSNLNSAYSTQTHGNIQKSKRILPQPKNIHDYIDDLFEVGRTNTDTAYLPRTSSAGKFRSYQWSK